MVGTAVDEDQRQLRGEESLKPECYSAYARYFVKYVEAMRGHGIHVSAVTPQNEPHNPKNEPSMVMTATDQAKFIKGYLGPELRKGAPETEILCWDHNCDEPEYPLTVLGDAEARAYIGGVAWHLYNGSPEAMSVVRAHYPAQKVYFTEQWVSAHDDFMGALRWHTKNVVIGSLEKLEPYRAGVEFCQLIPSTPCTRRNGAVGALGRRLPLGDHDQAKSRILSDGARGEVYPAGVGAGSFKRGGSASQRDLSDA